MAKKLILLCIIFLPFAAYAQENLEDYFNLCLQFGAPQDVVQLYQPFRTYKGENNGSISYVVKEDNSLIKNKPYSEYQIWYTIDKDLGLYQSSLIIRGDKPALQSILTAYLKKFSERFGEAVYTNLDNGSLLIFWYDETTLAVKARLLLDIVNSYKFVSITFCSPLTKHTNLLRTLYNGTPEEVQKTETGSTENTGGTSVEKPAPETPSIEAPPADDSSVEKPPIEEPPAENPSDAIIDDSAEE